MTTLSRRRAGILEEEFRVTSKELRLAFQIHAGIVPHKTALSRLSDWRWTKEDAEAFIELVNSIPVMHAVAM